MPITLGYWKLRGLAQPLRFLMTYAGAEFEEVPYEATGQPEKWDFSSWFSVKFTLGLPYPNLPYLIDGDNKITQTIAILYYLGRKFGLLGKTEEERIRCDMMILLVRDFHNGYVDLCYNTASKEEYEKKKVEYLENLQAKLKGFSDFLGDRSWLAGQNITAADFHFYEILDQHKCLEPSCLNEFKSLQDYCARFEALPAIAAYMKSPKCIKAPLNNKMAWFGNQ